MVDIFPHDYIKLIHNGVENAPQIEVADWQNWWISKSCNGIIFHIGMPLDAKKLERLLEYVKMRADSNMTKR